MHGNVNVVLHCHRVFVIFVYDLALYGQTHRLEGRGCASVNKYLIFWLPLQWEHVLYGIHQQIAIVAKRLCEIFYFLRM